MSRQDLQRVAWIAFALTAIVQLVALWTGLGTVAAATQPLIAPLLLVVLISRTRTSSRTLVLTVVALVLSWCGDTFPKLDPGESRMLAAGLFLAALIVYCVALGPLWWRSRDRYRMLLAIPYGGVVIGLFLACVDGVGPMLPIAVLYALALATTAFFAAGVNSAAWVGGALFLMSSSILAMSWFLPGAWIPHASFFVMLAYIGGQGFLVLGIGQALAETEPAPTHAGATLVILES